MDSATSERSTTSPTCPSPSDDDGTNAGVVVQAVDGSGATIWTKIYTEPITTGASS
ncbi:MAG: hypothetical protein LBB54_00300 [Cellulomonadaceae bacterium]|nr:hypothetical protein [Cellulomonadaceae bacterium]